uniref:EGF-like domain-containing protein n=1 Tax=Steinernema glaseri TaxID=37863 RepID=A0A1I7ZZA1_9BILA
MLLFSTVVLLLAASSTSAKSAKKTSNPCIPDPCFNNGKCVIAPFEQLGFACKCKPCFGGTTCSEDICTLYDKRYAERKRPSQLSMSLRTAGVSIGWVMLLLAVITIFLQQYRAAKEKKWFKRELEELRRKGLLTTNLNDDEISEVSTYPYPAKSYTYCSGIGSVIPGVTQLELSKPTIRKRSLSSSSLTSIVVNTSQTTTRYGIAYEVKPFKPRPGWDEVEMRRHGLINRQCIRPKVDNSGKPESVDVSVYERKNIEAPATGSSRPVTSH